MHGFASKMRLNTLQLSLQFGDLADPALHRIALPRHKVARWIRHALAADAEIGGLDARGYAGDEQAARHLHPEAVVAEEDVAHAELFAEHVYAAAGEAVRRARSGGGPTLIEGKTYRTRAHSEGMRESGYRSQEEIDA